MNWNGESQVTENALFTSKNISHISTIRNQSYTYISRICSYVVCCFCIHRLKYSIYTQYITIQLGSDQSEHETCILGNTGVLHKFCTGQGQSFAAGRSAQSNTQSGGFIDL